MADQTWDISLMVSQRLSIRHGWSNMRYISNGVSQSCGRVNSGWPMIAGTLCVEIEKHLQDRDEII